MTKPSGKTDRATCEELINAATRQYAKRQETWSRREKWLTPSIYHSDNCHPAALRDL